MATPAPAAGRSGGAVLLGDWRERHQSTLTESRHNVRVFFRDRLAVIGLAWIVLMIVVAVAAPWIAPYPEQGRGASDLQSRFESPSPDHPFGTDNQGRDVLSRVIFGARIPLVISAVVAAAVLLIGPLLGGLAGYYGGWADETIMRVTDIFLAFPALVLAMAMVAVLGPNLRNLALAIVVTWWPWYTRLVRGMAVSLRERPYVEAAKTMGVRDSRIVLRHILPNAFGPVVVQITLDIGTVILEVAGLSFLGLGAKPPTPEWGLMVSEGVEYVLEAWWMSVFPGLAIFLLVLAFNLVGDGLRDVLDPRMKR
jgi:peptide/nickel transport system permease protein